MKGSKLFKRIAVAVLSAVALTLTLSAAGSASSAPVGPLDIVRVGTDAMGTDTFDNRNREYVVIKNVSADTQDINGLVVEDNWAATHDFPSTCNTYKVAAVAPATQVLLSSGKFVTVYNGAGTNAVDVSGNMKLYANSNVDCGTQGHFFNNDADSVHLFKEVGDTDWSDSKSWDWGGGYYVR